MNRPIPSRRALYGAGLALVLLASGSRPAAAQGAAPGADPREPEEERTVLVPGGPFLMGTPEEQTRRPESERPQHVVNLPAFRIDRLEVTNAEYSRFLLATRSKHPASCHSLEPAEKDHTPDPRYWRDPEWNAPEKPVVGIDWYDAYAYCTWSGTRLPTEAEWEKAARGTEGRRHPWGDEALGSGRYGNFADESAKRLNAEWQIVTGYDDGFPHTAPVGSFPDGASPYGALDMLGNVWEWVNDRWSPDIYSAEMRSDPKGPVEGDDRVLRGGSWDSTPNFLHSATRYHKNPRYRNNSFGFRCARSAPSRTEGP